MKPYCDLGFLLALIVKARSTALAWRLAHRFDAPLPLNALHRLHIENTLTRQLYGAAKLAEAARAGLAEWRNKIDEAVFDFHSAEWELAFRQALQWNETAAGRPPHTPFLLHAALAATAGGFTHFLSFEPRSRTLARAAGLKLLPDHL
jgi:hypothetical protein